MKRGALVLWMLLLAGCWEPTETSSSGMAGHVLDHTGFPIVDVEVMSLEGRAITLSDGHFAVEYKAPDTYVSFDIGASTFRRNYQPADEGQVIDVQVSRLREVSIACEAMCAGRAQWDLGGGLTVRAAVACEPGMRTALIGVPVGIPELSCRGADAQLSTNGDAWTIRAPSRHIEVRAADSEFCRVSIGSTVATRVQDLAAEARVVYMGTASGDVTIKAVCDGIPVIPVQAAADVVSVEVVPSPGQTWDLGVEGLDAVDVYGLPDVGDSWSLRLQPNVQTLTTPVLPAGHYAILGPDALPIDPASLREQMSEQVPGELVRQDDGRQAVWRLRIVE
jgi:hypothetical protein